MHDSIRFCAILAETGDTTNTADGRRVLVDIDAAGVNGAPDAAADPATAGVKWATTSATSPSGSGWPVCDVEVRFVAAAAAVATWRPWTRSANSAGWHPGATRTVTVAAGRTFQRDSVQFSVVARDRVYVEVLTVGGGGTFDAWVNAQIPQL